MIRIDGKEYLAAKEALEALPSMLRQFELVPEEIGSPLWDSFREAVVTPYQGGPVLIRKGNLVKVDGVFARTLGEYTFNIKRGFFGDDLGTRIAMFYSQEGSGAELVSHQLEIRDGTQAFRSKIRMEFSRS